MVQFMTVQSDVGVGVGVGVRVGVGTDGVSLCVV